MPYTCIVVEADWNQILSGDFEQDIGIKSIFGTVKAIIEKFGVPVYFREDRELSRDFTLTFLEKSVKNCELLPPLRKREES